jgi:hypothetical protein
MHSNDGTTLFVGIKTSEQLREQLDSSKTSMKPFFEENDPEFLQIVQIDGIEYIGKGIESGASLDLLGNIFMNVKTMLKMICPEYSFTDDAIKIMAFVPMSSRTFF